VELKLLKVCKNFQFVAQLIGYDETILFEGRSVGFITHNSGNPGPGTTAQKRNSIVAKIDITEGN
jgi:hypothetical protein